MSRKPLQAEELTPEIVARHEPEIRKALRRLESIRRDMDDPGMAQTVHQLWRRSPGLDLVLPPRTIRKIKRACRKQN